MEFERLNFYWRVCAGVTYVLLLFYTALLGALTYMPVLITLFAIRFPLARWIADLIVGAWLGFAPAIYELFYGVKIKITGDVSKLNKKACSLVLLNHRTRLDGLFLTSLQARYASLRRFKQTMKYPLRYIPGAGWGMQVGGFLFLKRNFDEDKVRIENLLNHFKTWVCGPQLLLFPEGTDLREDSLENSKRYAKKNDLPDYDYVLHPRTTGFIAICEYMRTHNNLDQVVDVTIGYPKNMVQREEHILTKQLPQEILFHVKVFDIQSIPRDPTRLGVWLQEIWRKKEELLKRFNEQKCWPDKEGDLNYAQKLDIERDTVLYYVGVILYWIILSYLSTYTFVSFSIIRWYYLFSLFMCASVGHLYGVEHLLIKLDRR